MEESNIVSIGNPVIELFDYSAYSSTLTGIARGRYTQKLVDLNCDCPYAIEEGLWKQKNLHQSIPDITYMDLINYLVYNKRFYSQDQMNAYKSLDAYQRLQDNMFGEAKTLKLPSGNVLMKGKVNLEHTVMES